MVLNKPVGGSVAFSLDGGSEITVAGSGNIYSHVFPGVANGDHDVAAIVRNADGTEANSDINSMVGTGGDYYVTMGDSITNGLGTRMIQTMIRPMDGWWPSRGIRQGWRMP